MIFFLIVPLWISIAGIGALLTLAKGTRRLGLYIVCGSTFATLASFALSTLVLLGALKMGNFAGTWSGIILVIAYVLAVGGGGILGALGGFWLVFRSRVGLAH